MDEENTDTEQESIALIQARTIEFGGNSRGNSNIQNVIAMKLRSFVTFDYIDVILRVNCY